MCSGFRKSVGRVLTRLLIFIPDIYHDPETLPFKLLKNIDTVGNFTTAARLVLTARYEIVPIENRTPGTRLHKSEAGKYTPISK